MTDIEELQRQMTAGLTGFPELLLPVVATVRGETIRLSIKVVSPIVTSGSSQDLSATLAASHRLFPLPGVTLHPGDVLTTGTGERYQVVPPILRDPLGDVVGGSLLLVDHPPTPDPPVNPDPTPATPDPSSPPDDGWWREGLP